MRGIGGDPSHASVEALEVNLGDVGIFGYDWYINYVVNNVSTAPITSDYEAEILAEDEIIASRPPTQRRRSVPVGGTLQTQGSKSPVCGAAAGRAGM